MGQFILRAVPSFTEQFDILAKIHDAIVFLKMIDYILIVRSD